MSANIQDRPFLGWLKTGVGLALLIGVAVALYSVAQRTGIFGIVLLTALVIPTFVLTFIFIAKTVGLVLTIIFPPREATEISFSSTGIAVRLADGSEERYSWPEIRRMTLGEVVNGILIKGNGSAVQYMLPLTYKVLEQRIDETIAQSAHKFKKEKQWIASNRAGLNPDKDPVGVKRTYRERAGKGFRERTVDAAHGAEVIYYTAA